jgi:hypothetical protein
VRNQAEMASRLDEGSVSQSFNDTESPTTDGSITFR